MRVTVIASFLEIGIGTVVSGLTPEQIQRRRLVLEDLGKGRFKLTAATHFKQGETLEMDEVPKSLKEFVAGEGEHKAPAGKMLPPDLDAMSRAELVELAETHGIKVGSNNSKHDIILELKKSERAAKKVA